MKYKLVASDIDGTLLNDKNEVTPSVRRAIEAAQEQGTIFTLSTGRSIKGIGRYLDLLRGNAPVITYNGALITIAQSREVILKSEMPRSAADILIKRGIAEGAIVAAWANDSLYSTDTDSAYCNFYRSLGDVETPDISELPKGDVTKIVWILPNDKVIYLQDNYIPPEGVQSKSSGANLLEFFSCSAGKDKALIFLAKYSALIFPRPSPLATTLTTAICCAPPDSV